MPVSRRALAQPPVMGTQLAQPPFVENRQQSLKCWQPTWRRDACTHLKQPLHTSLLCDSQLQVCQRRAGKCRQRGIELYLAFSAILPSSTALCWWDSGAEANVEACAVT